MFDHALSTAHQILVTAVNILNDASPWLLIGFILAGVLHEIIPSGILTRALGNRRPAALIKAVLSGMLLPICSCGVIPLGLGLYYSGASLGPTLAFMCATPIINPIALFLAYGLLGSKLATIYLVTGFGVSLLIGTLGNWLGGRERQRPQDEMGEQPVELESAGDYRLPRRLLAGLRYGLMDLGSIVSRYVIWGIAAAAIIMSIVPGQYVQEYLGNPGLVSIVGIALLSAVMYVCAVGHIPFTAALLSAGAAPGIAITFLMAGAATNIPELLSIYKLIGRRTAVIYAAGMVSLAVIAGIVANMLLMPGFTPVFDGAGGSDAVNWAQRLILYAPREVKALCSGLIACMFLYSYWPQMRGWINGQ